MVIQMRKFLLALAICSLAVAGAAQAQYTPIPNYTGTNAGQQFRNDINNRFSGAVAIAPQISPPLGVQGAIESKEPGDANWRELLNPGTGYQVGNGSGAPSTVIDESGNVGSQNLTVKGASFESGIVTISSTPYPVASSDFNDDCNASGVAIAIDLPAATGSGRALTFKKIDSSANACTLTASGTDKIDGAATKALSSQYVGVSLRDEASGVWDVVNPGGSGGSSVTGGSCGTNQYADAIAVTTGAPTCAQPSFTQLSGSAACGQMPALTGDITSSGCAASFAIPTLHPLIGASSTVTDAASLTLNWSSASGFFISVMSVNTTIAFSGAVANQRIIVELQQAASGGPYTITWPVGIKWQGGTAPTMTATASKKDIYSFFFDGTDYLGIATQNF